MAAASPRPPAGGIGRRCRPASHRGGAASRPAIDEGAAARGAAPSGRMPGATRPERGSAAASASAAAGGGEFTGSTVEPADERHFELIVAGNPWLRSLWAVGAIATLVGFALTVYAEFAFSVPPASGIYDPSVYVVPRIAEAVAQPLVIAGVIALVAAMALRIVAWRPSRVTAVIAEK